MSKVVKLNVSKENRQVYKSLTEMGFEQQPGSGIFSHTTNSDEKEAYTMLLEPIQVMTFDLAIYHTGAQTFNHRIPKEFRIKYAQFNQLLVQAKANYFEPALSLAKQG